MSTTILAQGCILTARTSPGYGPRHEILELKTVTVPTISIPSVDVSDLKHVKRLFRAGIPDNGVLTFTFGWTNTVYYYLETIRAAKTEKNWEFTVSDASTSTWSFVGSITNLSSSAGDVDGEITGEVSIKVNGNMSLGHHVG